MLTGLSRSPVRTISGEADEFLADEVRRRSIREQVEDPRLGGQVRLAVLQAGVGDIAHVHQLPASLMNWRKADLGDEPDRAPGAISASIQSGVYGGSSNAQLPPDLPHTEQAFRVLGCPPVVALYWECDVMKAPSEILQELADLDHVPGDARGSYLFATCQWCLPLGDHGPGVNPGPKGSDVRLGPPPACQEGVPGRIAQRPQGPHDLSLAVGPQAELASHAWVGQFWSFSTLDPSRCTSGRSRIGRPEAPTKSATDGG